MQSQRVTQTSASQHVNKDSPGTTDFSHMQEYQGFISTHRDSIHPYSRPRTSAKWAKCMPTPES